jgi:histone deacetylase 1/2
MDDANQDEDLIPPDTRRPRRLLDSRRQGDGELSDSDDEGEGGRRNHAHHRDRSRSSDHESTSHSNGSGGRKFGLGVGIMMSSGQAATHGAGPSGHTTTARTLSMGGGSSAMDLDDTPEPPISESTDGVPREKSTERLPSTNGDGNSGMVVDPLPETDVQ